ncbi:MAG: cytochrome c oxidase assembly protein, partial [Microbacteriaceae bacterium]|nr:cytochrome c oxidase assembly protein [Microbacteriaceae bacterium]
GGPNGLATKCEWQNAKVPGILDVLGSWRLEPVSLAFAVIIAALYAAGLLNLARRDIRWPAWRTWCFYLLGVGSYVVVNLGFLGVWSMDLRFAFTTRIALLLFAVPALISLGGPVAMARLVLHGTSLQRLNAFLKSWPIRLVGNAVFAPLFALAVFMVFVTPFAGTLRQSTFAQTVLSIAIPVVGLLMVLPVIEQTNQRTSFFITVEFILVFVELIVDAIPGILIRLSTSILDGVGPVLGAVPDWFPSRMRDQQLSGDLLWFIAEISDIPILILLFVRWSKVDHKEAKNLDELTDEEMDALTQQHLRGPRD